MSKAGDGFDYAGPMGPVDGKGVNTARGVTFDLGNVPLGLRRGGYVSLKSHQSNLMGTGGKPLSRVEAERAGYSEEEIVAYFGAKE